MTPAGLRQRLSDHVTRQSVHEHRTGGMMMLGAVAVLLVTYFLLVVAFWVLFTVFGWTPRGEVLPPLVSAALGVGLLFLVNARMARGSIVSPSLGGSRTARPADPLLRKHLSDQLVLSVILGGPRLATEAWHAYRKAARLRLMDLDTCAIVLGQVLAMEERLPLAVLGHTLSPADLDRALAQLRDLDGVLFLESPPPALAVADRLRKDLEGNP